MQFDSNTALLIALACVAGGYLLGSVSFAVLVTRVMGMQDPRTYGSKNPGASNVLRQGSKAAAVATLALDALKGTVAVLICAWLGREFGFGRGFAALAGLAAFVGHLWPVFFRFVGGKGVATALGVLLGLNWGIAAATAVVWVLVAVMFRYSSLAALLAAAFAAAAALVSSTPMPTTLCIIVMSALLIYRHKTNIEALMNGKERKFGQKPTDLKSKSASSK